MSGLYRYTIRLTGKLELNQILKDARVVPHSSFFSRYSNQPVIVKQREIWGKLPTSYAMKMLDQTRKFSTSTNEVNLKKDMQDNLFKISIPLSNMEKCLFAIRSETTIRQFLEDVVKEDPAIQKATIYQDGARVSMSSPVGAIFQSNFEIALNDKKYPVSIEENSVPNGKLSIPTQLLENDDTKVMDLQHLKQEMIPLFLQKKQLDEKALKRANLKIWGGFGFLVAQWCVLARLTWWEFNWDIMEPVTFFITFGTAVIGYLYFAVTKREYSFADLRDSFTVANMKRLYERNNFNVDRYFWLQHKINRMDPYGMIDVEGMAQKAEETEREKKANNSLVQ